MDMRIGLEHPIVNYHADSLPNTWISKPEAHWTIPATPPSAAVKRRA